jgi:hypothetical protein
MHRVGLWASSGCVDCLWVAAIIRQLVHDLNTQDTDQLVISGSYTFCVYRHFNGNSLRVLLGEWDYHPPLRLPLMSGVHGHNGRVYRVLNI